MSLEKRLKTAPIGVIEVAAGEVVDVNPRAAEALDTTVAELRGTAITESFPRSASGTLRAAWDGDTVDEVSFEEYYPRIDRWLEIDISVDESVIVYVQDRTEQHEVQRTVDQHRIRLERLQGINDLVAAVLQRVIGAASREDVGRTMCERLGGADLYGFAWVGEREFPEERLRSLAAAGTELEVRDAIDAAMDSGQTLPEQRALSTGETQHVTAIAEDESVPEAVRRAAFSEGLQSCLAIPLAYQDTVYGVVSVYSQQENGFSDPERVGLETLASVAGFAIRAIRQEGLLVADTATEVTVAVDDESLPIINAAAAVGTTVYLDGVVPRGDGAAICYLHGDGLDEDFAERLRTSDAVADLRWIRTDHDPAVQVTIDDEVPVTSLISWGANVREAEYTPESAQYVAEIPPDSDVRRLVEAIDDTAEGTRLVAKSESTGGVTSLQDFRETLDERLTDRQRAVLRTAYLSDYFASPRGSTSDEVADTLDIAGSTLLYHLRRAEEKLVGAYLDRADDASSND